MLSGDVLMRAERYDDAEKAYLAAIGKQASGALAVRLFNARQQAGRTDRAIAGLKEWTTAHPDDRAPRHVLANTYLSLGRYDEAIRDTEALLADEPN
ncbi:MAG: tetratricopeptide repeat protein, partial [Alphaproteobacteria bacterium]|nr:tetratricopeptide repeat protein [Alphaproteobacteria bacterium]